MTIYLFMAGRRELAGLALLASLVLIQGCRQPEPGRFADPTPVSNITDKVRAHPPSPQDTALRMVVKFRTAGSGRDAALLAGLARQAQAPVSYVTSVSPDTHVYRIEPAAGQRADEILARLLATPGVAFVEVDKVVRGL